ncbi:hypothetical protein GCM10010172_04490 [Paractinoplanes ferrugineus]|uniref:Uncharacterized protein n=1 Tax=Paractinoplanes ferrugineus TaxID=113564 RepID=A0A919MJ87_9ACTN|nr:hypothetical protein [Actinoplanes ferrugineus]GIE16834.1 hypothetical protein Afe05nite_86740 [Actinoplanes ferrugineus]
MTAVAWFAAGAFFAGPLFGLVWWWLLAPQVRRHAYDVCQERARLEYGPKPACSEGFDVPEPKHRRRWALLNRKRPEPAPATSGPVSILGKQAL